MNSSKYRSAVRDTNAQHLTPEERKNAVKNKGPFTSIRKTLSKKSDEVLDSFGIDSISKENSSIPGENILELRPHFSSPEDLQDFFQTDVKDNRDLRVLLIDITPTALRKMLRLLAESGNEEKTAPDLLSSQAARIEKFHSIIPLLSIIHSFEDLEKVLSYNLLRDSFSSDYINYKLINHRNLDILIGVTEGKDKVLDLLSNEEVATLMQVVKPDNLRVLLGFFDNNIESMLGDDLFLTYHTHIVSQARFGNTQELQKLLQGLKDNTGDSLTTDKISLTPNEQQFSIIKEGKSQQDITHFSGVVISEAQDNFQISDSYDEVFTSLKINGKIVGHYDSDSKTFLGMEDVRNSEGRLVIKKGMIHIAFTGENQDQGLVNELFSFKEDQQDISQEEIRISPICMLQTKKSNSSAHLVATGILGR